MNDMAPSNHANLPADMDSFDMSGFDEAITELAPGDEVVRFQNGKWIWQKDEKIRLENGQELAVNIWEMQRGWLRFEGEGADSKLAEKRLGKVCERYRPEPRDQLGFADKSLWKKDADGDPMDPWVSTWQFPAILIGEKGNYQVMMAGTSVGWERAVGALIQQWKAQQPSNHGKIPVITLGFREAKTRYGDRDFPVMTISKWRSIDDFQIAESDAEEEKEKEPKKAVF